MLINFDLSQIEIVILAQLSQDLDLIQMMKDGVDLYRYFAAVMYQKNQKDITKQERDSLKAPVLSISYGKGAKHMSEDSGKSVEWCQEFIDLFYQTFPGVRDLHQRWIDEVNRTGYIRMPWGINLRFYRYLWDQKNQEKVRSDHPRARYWEPEIKNYPIQHTAFLFISTYISRFFREKAIYNKDKYLMICTVHDSLTLDCRPEYLDDAVNDLKIMLDKLPEIMYNQYNLKLDVPIRAEIEAGDDLYTLMKIEDYHALHQTS